MDFLALPYSLAPEFGFLCVYIYIFPKTDISSKCIVSPCALVHEYVEKVPKKTFFQVKEGKT